MIQTQCTLVHLLTPSSVKVSYYKPLDIFILKSTWQTFALCKEVFVVRSNPLIERSTYQKWMYSDFPIIKTIILNFLLFI